MKKLCFAALMITFLMLPSLSRAQPIQAVEVQVSYTTGATADYVAGAGPDDGTLAWDGGAQTVILMNGGPGQWLFHSTVVDVDWDLYSDDTGGGNPKAKFDLVGSWAAYLYDWTFSVTDPAVTLTGTMNSGMFGGRYWEEKSGIRALEGKAWVNVTVTADSAWELLFLSGDNLIWDADDIAGLETDVTLDPLKPDIINYQSDYDAPNGLSITLKADQSQVVPEPATIALLGLGGLLLLRRRR